MGLMDRKPIDQEELRAVRRAEKFANCKLEFCAMMDVDPRMVPDSHPDVLAFYVKARKVDRYRRNKTINDDSRPKPYVEEEPEEPLVYSHGTITSEECQILGMYITDKRISKRQVARIRLMYDVLIGTSKSIPLRSRMLMKMSRYLGGSTLIHAFAHITREDALEVRRRGPRMARLIGDVKPVGVFDDLGKSLGKPNQNP